MLSPRRFGRTLATRKKRLMTTPLRSLPDCASLERVAQALWEGEEPRGAALMVGAGLSRSALRMSDDAPLAPLWTDFADAMALRSKRAADR